MLSRTRGLHQYLRFIPWLRCQSCLTKDVMQPVCRQLHVSGQQKRNSDVEFDELTLTKQEAISYLEKVLLIQDPSTFAQKHKYQFLCEVQRRTKFTQPFTVMTFPPEGTGLRCQTNEETKEDMFKRRGGGCFQINTFTKAVLRQFGYQVYLVCGTLSKERANVYDAHTGLVVKDVTQKGSMHLVDPGTRHPILDPVSLDFRRSSTEYQLPGHPIKFFRDTPSIVKLCMPISKVTDVKRDSNLYHEDGKMWRGMITYRTLETQLWEYCRHITDMLIKSAKLMPSVHNEIIVCGYCEGLWTIIKGKSFLQYDKNNKQFTKQFKTNQEVVENIRRCFPQYSKEMLQDDIAYRERASKLLALS